MYCIYVWRPIMEAISTLENIRPPVVSRWSQKVNNCLRLQCQNILLYIIIEYSLTIWNIDPGKNSSVVSVSYRYRSSLSLKHRFSIVFRNRRAISFWCRYVTILAMVT